MCIRDRGYKEPGDTPGEQSTESDESSGYPDEESKEDSDNGTNDGNGNPEEPEIDEEKDEEPAGSFESELEPAKAALTVTHILLLDDGDEELMEIAVSYTHLDVYKRQLLTPCPMNLSRQIRIERSLPEILPMK